MTDPNTEVTISLPSSPNPATTALVAAVIRHVLAALGACGVTIGGVTNISDSNLLIVVGANAWLASVCWSLWQKYRQAAHTHAAAQASAKLGVPVRPG
jgi:hypothetical protein